MLCLKYSIPFYTKILLTSKLHQYMHFKVLLNKIHILSFNSQINKKDILEEKFNIENTAIDNTLLESSYNINAEDDSNYNKFGLISKKEYLECRYNDDGQDEGTDEDSETFKLFRKRLSTKKYADIIKDFIRRRKIKEAIEVLEIRILKEDRVKPSNYLYNLLIGACGRVGYTKKAFSLFNDMKKRGLEVHSGCYTALFNACANSPWSDDGLSRARKLRNLMIEKKYQPNDTNYNAMIKAFGRCGDINTAFSLVDEMVSNQILPTCDTFNFLLQACASNRKQGFRFALLTWRKMIEKNIKPNLYSYNLILRIVRDCSLGEICTVQNLIEDMQKNNVVSSNEIVLYKKNKESKCRESEGTETELYLCKNESFDLKVDNMQENEILSNDLMIINEIPQPDNNNNNSLEIFPNLLAKVPHLGNIVQILAINEPKDKMLLIGGCLGFLKEMEANHVSPNIKTFTQLLDNIPSTLSAEKMLLSKMKSFKIKPDVDFFNMLIKRRCLRYDYNEAKDVLILIENEKLKPDLITYGVLAMSCTKHKDGIALLSMMSENHYRPNTEILGTLLHQACNHTNFYYILEIMERTIKEGIDPNLKFLECLKNFQQKCTDIAHKGKNEKLASSDSFKKGYKLFNLRYKNWLKQVKVDKTEDLHPWTQFREESKTEAKFLDKQTHFKQRHISQFKVKTSNKVRN